MELKKVILFIIDGMDTVNFTMANTPVMSGWHGKTAVGVAHTEIIGAGATITPIAHGMMGTGFNITAHRPGAQTRGKCYDYYGNPVETIGDVAREAGLITAAVGKNEAAIVLGGTDVLDISRLEKDGVDTTDSRVIVEETLKVYERIRQGIIVVTYNAVDYSGHIMSVGQLIDSVERADKMVGEMISKFNLAQTLVVIAADHGTNPLTGNHNTAPTPLCLITEAITGRVNLGIVHNLEIAITICSALKLKPPVQALGRNLLDIALKGSRDLSYKRIMEQQLLDLYNSQPKRYQLAKQIK